MAVLGRQCCVGSSSLSNRGLLSSSNTQPPHCSGLSCCRALAQLWRHMGSAVAAPGLQSTGSTVVARRLSSSAACGLFPDQGLNSCLLHRWILYHWDLQK